MSTIIAADLVAKLESIARPGGDAADPLTAAEAAALLAAIQVSAAMMIEREKLVTLLAIHGDHAEAQESAHADALRAAGVYRDDPDSVIRGYDAGAARARRESFAARVREAGSWQAIAGDALGVLIGAAKIAV